MGIVTEKLESQGVLAPGEQGYWKVWGARAGHIRTGDLAMFRWADADEPDEIEIAEVLDRDPCAPKFRCTDGRVLRIGGLMPVIVLRHGDHNTLA